jgi:gas vesicle protein
MKRKSSRVKGIAIGSGLAAIAGFLAGILTAPKSGKATRKDIKSAAENSRFEAEKDLKKLHKDLDSIIGESKGKSKKLSKKTQKDLQIALDTAADTKEKVREVLSAIRQGDAKDQDLKRAIKNANTSLEHLRDFLKK